MAQAAKNLKSKLKDPFKTRKTKTDAGVSDTLTPPPELQQLIDKFRECQDQAKHFEGEATAYKEQIMEYARNNYSQRALIGQEKSFKILGEESVVTYVAMDASAGLSDEDVEEIRERWGDAAIETLITADYRSIRFDPQVLEANYEEVVASLQQLPDDVLERLFKPMLRKTKTNAVTRCQKIAKTPEDLQELMQQLKLRHYIR